MTTPARNAAAAATLSEATGTSHTWSVSITSPSNSAMVLNTGRATTITGATYAASAMTLVQTATNGAAVNKLFVRATGATSGANNAVVSTSSSEAFQGAAAAWDNVDQTTPYSQATTNNGSSASPTIAVTTTSGDVIVGGMVHQSTKGSYAISVGTQDALVAAGGIKLALARNTATGASTSLSYTNAYSASWAAVACILTPFVAAGAGLYNPWWQVGETDIVGANQS